MKFNFETAESIIFGSGKVAELSIILLGFGDRALVVTGVSSRFDSILDNIKASGVSICRFKLKSEPEIEDVDAAVTKCISFGANVIIAIGGGSVMDLAKAVGAMVTNLKGDEGVLDYLEVIGKGKKLNNPSLPVIAIPTTAGTGTEVTKNAVLKSTTHKRKVSLRSQFMLPKRVIIDPELMVSLPKDVTVSSGMDALTQVIEPFVSCLSNPFIDALCRDAIPRVLPALKVLISEPENLHAREEMAYVSLIGGIALANAKLGAVHGFAGPIGGMFNIPHGVVCSILLPHVLKMNFRAVQLRGSSDDVKKYREVDILIGDNASAKVSAFNRSVGVKTLSDYGVKKEHLKEIAELSINSSSMKGNTVPLTMDELLEILELAL